MLDEIQKVAKYREDLEAALNQLLALIGTLQIYPPNRFPFGWRKAAKGRTVWRLLEEVVTQNLELKHRDIGINSLTQADSEVGVYDFSCSLDGQETVFVNIKSAIKGDKLNKDDISKARKLEKFFSTNSRNIMLIATFEIEFLSNMKFRLNRCTVIPVMWLPDIYVNPSSNANLQSSKYKSLEELVQRSGQDFLELLREAIKIADAKRKAKKS